MALSNQFFVKGLDFTGFVTAAATDFNNLVDLAMLKSDTASEGKGVIVWTKDSALDTPIVPDATTITTFKRCIWVRIPHATATSKIPLFYGWNDDSVSDPTYLKWSRIEADLSAIEADITALEADIATVEGIANNANSAVSIANTNAATALADSASALATANTANTNATQAITDSAAAQADANAAQTTADTALTNANAAQVTANNANTNADKVAANKFFTSGTYVISDGIVADTPHGLAGKPKFVRGVIVCQTAEHGYLVGDEIELCYVNSQTGDDDRCPFSVAANVENVILICDEAGVNLKRIRSKATPSGSVFMTDANWLMKAYAWL